MLKVSWYWVLISTVAYTIITGCTRQSEYHRMVETELAKGVRHDSLFLGLQLGMASKDFYAHCWELNKKGLIRQGPQNMTVEYKINDLKHPATMNFYPSFHEDKIYEMPVTFAYEGWAPWNKDLFADRLQLDVLKLYERWYGKGFIKIEHSQRGAAYVKVDGNRRISIYKDINDKDVNVLYTDLKVDQKIEAEKASSDSLD